jgi:hypothetical protein
MHDEDSANGLWVRNKRGDWWAAYGDKQLWSAKSNQNYRMAVKAAQAGLDEVRKTYATGEIPAADEFSALKLVRAPRKINPMCTHQNLLRPRYWTTS